MMATFNEPSKGDGPPSGAGDVLVRVKQEEDSKIEVAARLGLPSAFAERHSHLSGGDGTSGTSGRSSSNSAMTSSPHSTPPPVDVKPQLTVSAVPLVLANQSITRTQNLSPGLSERQPNNQDNKRINNNTASYQSGGRLKFFKGDVCLLELGHAKDESTWRPITKKVYWPPPGPVQAESSPSLHSVSEAGSDIVAHSPSSAVKNESPPSITSQSHRLKSIPSKFHGQPKQVTDQLCFALNPPPCMSTIRRNTKNLRKYCRNPTLTLSMGTAMMALIRFEGQAVKSRRPPRRPFDLERNKKISKVTESLVARGPKPSSVFKPKKPVVGPITPWKPRPTASGAPTAAAATAAAPTTVTKRVIKSELCPVTETHTASTMPPSSPSTSSKHKKAETRTSHSTPDRNKISPSPRALPIPVMPGRIRQDGPLIHHSASFVSHSPDFQRVKVEIAREQHQVHRAHTAQIPLGTGLSPDFTSPRKRGLKDGESSPSKRHRPSTDSRGSAGSSDGMNSGTASPMQRVGSPGSLGASPQRFPPPRSNSFSIESLISSRDDGSRVPVRPVAIPASPVRHSPSRSPISRPSPSHSQSPPETPQSHHRRSPVNVSVTPYSSRKGMDPSTPIDPRLAHLAGLSANPSLGLRPTGGVPGTPTTFDPIMATQMMNPGNPLAMYAMAAAAQAAAASQIWAAHTMAATNAARRLTTPPPSTTPGVSFGTPTRPSPVTAESRSPIGSWTPQYRGAPKPDKTPNSEKSVTDAPLDLCMKRE